MWTDHSAWFYTYLCFRKTTHCSGLDLSRACNTLNSSSTTSAFISAFPSNGILSCLVMAIQVVAALKGCVPAICDKVPQSAKGSIIAVTDLIVRRGAELGEADVSR